MTMTLLEVANKVATDKAYRKNMLANPSKTLAEAGFNVPAGVVVEAHESKGKDRCAVLPEQRPDGYLYELYLRDTLTAAVAQKAWTDAEYKKRLFADPKKAVEEAVGHRLPADVKVTVFENNAKTLHLVLPPEVSTDGALSDDDLEKVSGGAGKGLPPNFKPSNFPPAPPRSGGAPMGGGGGRKGLPPFNPSQLPPPGGGGGGGRMPAGGGGNPKFRGIPR